MRLNSLILALLPLVITGCSKEKSVPRIDAGMPIVLHLTLPSEKFPKMEIKLPTKAAETFRPIVSEMSLNCREPRGVTKPPLAVFVVGDHEFLCRGAILYYLSSYQSGA